MNIIVHHDRERAGGGGRTIANSNESGNHNDHKSILDLTFYYIDLLERTLAEAEKAERQVGHVDRL